MPTHLALTRSARWVSNFANVPRFGLRPNLLLDLAKPQVHATSDTQRTLLVAVGVIPSIRVTLGTVGDPKKTFLNAIQKVAFGAYRT